MGMSARWPPCPLGGLPLTHPLSVGGGATVPIAASVILLQVQLRLGGGISFEELSKGLYSGSSRGCLALKLGLCLLHCGGRGCGSSLFGLFLGTGSLGFLSPLQPSLLRL